MARSRRLPWLWVLLGGFLICSACASFLMTGYALGRWWRERAAVARVTATPEGSLPLSSSTEPVPTRSSTPTSTPTISTQTPPTQTPESKSNANGLPSRLQAIMERIENEVIEIRGLKPKHPVERIFLSREALRQKVEEDFFKDYSQDDAWKDVLELWTWGLLPRDFDLFSFYRDIYSEMIAGFYDDEEGKMYVVAEGFPAYARITYAHEFTHALQDQQWDLDKNLNYNNETCKQDSEYCGALQALIEGDASLVELEWFWTKATPREQDSIRRYYQSLENPVFDQAPEFFKKELLFPYNQGTEFVQYLHAQGGWEAVNQAYAQPPLSTEQILHPERYPKDKPIKVQLPDLSQVLKGGWEPIVEYNTLGEFWLLLVLRYGVEDSWRLSRIQAERAAEGWGGDAYALYYHADLDAVALVMDIRWDTAEDLQEFREAFLDYAEARFGPYQTTNGWYRWDDTLYGTVLFQAQKDRALWIVAPETVVEALRDAMIYGSP